MFNDLHEIKDSVSFIALGEVRLGGITTEHNIRVITHSCNYTIKLVKIQVLTLINDENRIIKGSSTNKRCRPKTNRLLCLEIAI